MNESSSIPTQLAIAAGIVFLTVYAIVKLVPVFRRNGHSPKEPERERMAGEKSTDYWESRNRDIFREEIARAMQPLHDRPIDLKTELNNVRAWQQAQDWRDGERERRR